MLYFFFYFYTFELNYSNKSWKWIEIFFFHQNILFILSSSSFFPLILNKRYSFISCSPFPWNSHQEKRMKYKQNIYKKINLHGKIFYLTIFFHFFSFSLKFPLFSLFFVVPLNLCKDLSGWIEKLSYSKINVK